MFTYSLSVTSCAVLELFIHCLIDTEIPLRSALIHLLSDLWEMLKRLWKTIGRYHRRLEFKNDPVCYHTGGTLPVSPRTRQEATCILQPIKSYRTPKIRFVTSVLGCDYSSRTSYLHRQVGLHSVRKKRRAHGLFSSSMIFDNPQA